MDKIFRWVSFLAAPFIGYGVYYFFMIFKEDVIYLNDIGYALFFIGLGVSFEGLDDSKKYLKLEKALFKKRKLFKTLLAFQFVISIILLIAGLYFYTISLFKKGMEPDMINGYKNLSLGVFSIAVGFISSFKYNYSREKAFRESEKEYRIIS